MTNNEAHENNATLTVINERYPLAGMNTKLPRSFHPLRVMADAASLRLKIEDYFSLLGTKHPTPPGLAMAMGLGGFDNLMKIVKTEEDSPGTYPEDSIAVLEVARSFLEDYYLSQALRENVPAQFTKFILSAFFNRSEKTIQEQLGGTDKDISINILGIGSALPQPHTQPNSQPHSQTHTQTHTQPQETLIPAQEDLYDPTTNEPLTICYAGHEAPEAHEAPEQDLLDLQDL